MLSGNLDRGELKGCFDFIILFLAFSSCSRETLVQRSQILVSQLASWRKLLYFEDDNFPNELTSKEVHDVLINF